jgi:hypothetical protein
MPSALLFARVTEMPAATHDDGGRGDSGCATLRVTEVGEFVRFDSCERRFRLSFNRRSEARRLPFFNRLFNPLDPILQQAGLQSEKVWQRQLRDAGYRDLSPEGEERDDRGTVRPKETPFEVFAASVQALALGERAFCREVLVAGTIGAFRLEGRIDFALIRWQDGAPWLRLIEGKASRRDRTYHRIQVVAYRMLVQQHLAGSMLLVAGCPLAGIEVTVARVEEDTGQPQDLEVIPILEETEREQADIERLLSAGGRFTQILAADLDALPFQLSGKCDACVFNVHCLSESSRQRRLELLGIEPSAAAGLRSAGLRDIDAVAEVALDGGEAAALRRLPGFTESLPRLRERARARRSTLPRGEGNPDLYEVQTIQGAGGGQLPAHEQGGVLLVRVYLAVDYDYTENRIGALTAHVTRSPRQLHLTFLREGDRWRPDPTIYERRRVPRYNDQGRFAGWEEDEPGPLDAARSLTICRPKTSTWTGRAEQDTGSERELIAQFFHELVEAIAAVAAPDEQVRLHFYVWSRTEMVRLVEGCARSSTQLLGSLRELLGCRESLEQLIYSVVGEEIDSRYGLGWTSRGLVVAASLRWFGQRFHWLRRVRGRVVALDELFTQDIFDFKTTLGLRADGTWAADTDHADVVHRFEIRARNFDTLPAPYWRAIWHTLPSPHELNSAQVKTTLERYRRADYGHVVSYLEARAMALRWLEERVAFKNNEIAKQPIPIAELPTFDLGVHDLVRASIDVLRLDHHMAMTSWIAERLPAMRDRVAAGKTLPVRDVRYTSGNTLTASLDLGGYDIDAETAQALWAPDAWVRLSVRRGEADRPQTIRQLRYGGLTGILTSIDWEDGIVTIKGVPGQAALYRLFSKRAEDCDGWEFAAIDPSPSDFVAGRVERRLLDQRGAPATRWLDPLDPRIAEQAVLDHVEDQALSELLQALQPDDHRLDAHQVNAIRDSIDTRIHLLQGPPGTGKTTTTAVAILTRILLRRSAGELVVVGATTHTAINELLRRLAGIAQHFGDCARARGYAMPEITLVKVHSGDDFERTGDHVTDVVAAGCVGQVQQLASQGVVVVGGTTSALLNLAGTLARSFPTVPDLIVDEASMMVFPHFLALATWLRPDGQALLAGDKWQLRPILAHDWEAEDRPPIERYQPFLSAYDAVEKLAADPHVSPRSVRRSGLELSFRLPPRIVDLIARVYREDEIVLRGVHAPRRPAAPLGDDPWHDLWRGEAGLYLIVHDESASLRANPVEVEIVERICRADGAADPDDIAVITPHRAQRTMLARRLAGRASIVDTVERLQGGERRTIIVSGTVSDPCAIASSAEFILNLNRSNVAFSRVQERLFVVCASTLLDHIPAEIEQYDSAMLWKALRRACAVRLAEVEVAGHRAVIYGPSPEAVEERPAPV